MWVMLQTLDENVPRHQDRVANPGNAPAALPVYLPLRCVTTTCLGTGLVIRPRAAEIFFNRSDASNYDQYVQQLHELLQREFTHTHTRRPVTMCVTLWRLLLSSVQ